MESSATTENSTPTPEEIRIERKQRMSRAQSDRMKERWRKKKATQNSEIQKVASARSPNVLTAEDTGPAVVSKDAGASVQWTQVNEPPVETGGVEEVSVTPAPESPVFNIPGAPASTQGISLEDLTKAMEILGGTMGSELRKGDPEAEQERDAERLRAKLAQEAERKVVAEAKALTDRNQAYCESLGHKMDNGRSNRSAVFGQVCSDGKYHSICMVCQKEFVTEVEQSQMPMGVS
jgi:hypothetical protein